MKLSDVVYSLGWWTVRPALAVAGLFSNKLARAVEGRKRSVAGLERWVAGRDPALPTGRAPDPVLWLHGASAGEIAGAAPIVGELRRDRPDLGLLVTYSSPSGEAAAARLDPDHHDFVPLDLRSHTDAAIAAVRPAALVYAKHDVWPNLTGSAREAGVPIGLVNATVRPGSARLRQPGRAVLRQAYEALDLVGAVSEADRSRLESLGARPRAIRVTGDASFDQAIARLRAGGRRPLRLPPRSAGILRLVAGSTWPEDEDLLVDTVADLRAVELILVPHEPTNEAVARLGSLIERRFGRPPRLYSGLEPSGGRDAESGVAPPPLIVDTVGLLAELYAEGDLGYVGGAQSGTGLHSVVEPAAAGLPVIFGPRHDRWEADELLAAGAAREVDRTSLYATLVSLLDPQRRRRLGQAALDFVEEHAGAGRAGAALIEELLEPAAPGEPAGTTRAAGLAEPQLRPGE